MPLTGGDHERGTLGYGNQSRGGGCGGATLDRGFAGSGRRSTPSRMARLVGHFLGSVCGRDGAGGSGRVRVLPALVARHDRAISQRHGADDLRQRGDFRHRFVALYRREREQGGHVETIGWRLAARMSVAVALSTILIIASVGYAQKRPMTRTATTMAPAGANETRTATREEFITAWRANGHTSITVFAQELGVKPRTAQKWVKADKAQQS
jgi:hypothetical protein